MGLPYNYNRQSEYDAYAPIRTAFNITPSATELSVHTRAVMVSVDATITGILAEDSSSHTTHTLLAGTLYPFAFKVISAVSAGTVKGYA